MQIFDWWIFLQDMKGNHHTFATSGAAGNERLRQNPAHGWKLDEMAREAHLSRAQFARRFRARFGTSPGEWLLRLRIEIARQKLLESEATLERIARDVGFCDAAHFSRAFKRLSGRAPGELR